MEAVFIDLFTVVLLNCIGIGVIAGVVSSSWQHGKNTFSAAVYISIAALSVVVPLYYLYGGVELWLK